MYEIQIYFIQLPWRKCLHDHQKTPQNKQTKNPRTTLSMLLLANKVDFWLGSMRDPITGDGKCCT